MARKPKTVTQNAYPDGAAQPPRLTRLSRLRDTLRRRDWVGVSIEILIVTLGILLAFRVEQWGEQRKKAADERDFLQRLYLENSQAIVELRALNDSHSRTVMELEQAIHAKSDTAALQRLASRQVFGCWMMQIPAASYSNTTSEELVSSGRLSLIEDTQLRADIRSLAAAQAEGAARVAYSREITQLFSPYLHAYHRLSLGENPKAEPICFVDWRALMSDQLAATAVVRTYRAHSLAQRNRRALLLESERVQRALGCALGKPGCRGSPR